MNEDVIKDALRELDQVNPPPMVPPEVLRRARARRLARGSLAVVATAALVAGASFTIESARDEHARPTARARAAAGGTTPAPVFDSWRVEVSVEPSTLSDLALAASDFRAAPDNDARPWIQHTFSVENLGSRPVEIDDTRTSAFVPGDDDRQLLVADEGCGYGQVDAASVAEAGACRRNLDVRTIAPGEVETWTMTLFKDLPGLAALRPGAYRFEKSFRFRFGTGEWQQHDVDVVYRFDE